LTAVPECANGPRRNCFLVTGGTEGSNPSPSSGESANHRSLSGGAEPRVRIPSTPAESRANHRFLSGGAHVPHSLALRPRQLGDTRRGRTRRHGESVAQTRGQRQVGLLAAGEGGRLITTSGPKSAVVLESSLADNIASPANDIERGGLLGIAIPNRRGRWQSCSKTALVSFGRSRR
jgi:hypothetical protein